MIKNSKFYRFSYIFIFLSAVTMAIVGVFYTKYNIVENKIIKYDLHSNVEHIAQITTNINSFLEKDIKGSIYDYFRNHPNKIKRYKKYLRLFITKKYKFVYLIKKNPKKDNNFIYVLKEGVDINQNSKISNSFKQLLIKHIDKVYSAKKPVYFVYTEQSSFSKNSSPYFANSTSKDLWLTYLKPIIINGKVDALLAMEASLKDHNKIVSLLKDFDIAYEISLVVFIAILLIIILFSILDIRRENEKDRALKKVEKINLELEKKINSAVEDSRKKDQMMFQQSRLAQMGEMLSMIAHQWRQPLSAISSTASTLKIKATLNKIDKDMIIEKSKDIVKYSKHLSSTIDDFRNFFKTKKTKEDTDLNEIIKSVLNIFNHSLENYGISLKIDLNYDKTFLSYPNEIKQVVLNIIKNAEDNFIDKEIKGAEIYIKTYEKENKPVLEILDNGGGIPKNIINKIFDPYFSTKKKKDGTGLGLYMSKVIIEEHCNGKIEVENKNNGALFRIVFGGSDA